MHPYLRILCVAAVDLCAACGLSLAGASRAALVALHGFLRVVSLAAEHRL